MSYVNKMFAASTNNTDILFRDALQVAKKADVEIVRLKGLIDKTTTKPSPIFYFDCNIKKEMGE